MKEVTLNTDSFNRNPVFEGETAILRQIYNLIVMKKGTDSLNPNKGVDINRYYYKFKDDVDLKALEQEIKEQVAKYTDYVVNNVSCKTILTGTKWILYVFLTIPPISDPIVIASNGEFAQFTQINTFSTELIKETK